MQTQISDEKRRGVMYALRWLFAMLLQEAKCNSFGSLKNGKWVVVKILVPFRIPIIIRHLIFRVPKKEP